MKLESYYFSPPTTEGALYINVIVVGNGIVSLSSNPR